MARFGTSAIMASGTADAVSVTPKSLRREKSPKGLDPNPMPIARPIRIAAKTRLNPADPPPSVYWMYEGARPITTPAAQNAPSIPITRPRTTGVCRMKRQPSTIALAIDGAEIDALCSRLPNSPPGGRDGHRGDEVGRAVEEQRQVHLVGVEDRDDMAEPGGDVAEHGEQGGRQRRGAVGH